MNSAPGRRLLRCIRKVVTETSVRSYRYHGIGASSPSGILDAERYWVDACPVVSLNHEIELDLIEAAAE